MRIYGTKSFLRQAFLKKSVCAVSMAAGIAIVCASSAWGILQGQGVPLRSAPSASVATGATTIVIVRHGEKAADDPRDPTLSIAGQTRAVALATALDGAEVGAIYSTQFKRTRATVEPLAKRFNVPVTARPIGSGDVAIYAAQLARDVLAQDVGKTVAIVGHSNTVPELVKAFSGRAIPSLTDEDYDHLYIIVRPSTGPARLFQTRYGAPRTVPLP
jgi:phosphohistidine phosphatase SixA